MLSEFALFKRWRKSLANDRSAKGLLIVTTTLNAFILVNCRRFAKFAKLSTHQTFLLYGYIGLCLNHAHAGQRPMRAWFLKIIFVQKVSMYVGKGAL